MAGNPLTALFEDDARCERDRGADRENGAPRAPRDMSTADFEWPRGFSCPSGAVPVVSCHGPPGSLGFELMKGQDKPKKLGKKVPQKSLKEKRKEKKAKKDSGSSSF